MQVGGVVGIAGAAGYSYGTSFIGAHFSALIAPSVLGTQQGAFYNNPWNLPSPDAILHAYTRRFVAQSTARWGLRMQGVSWDIDYGRGATNDDRARNHLWQGVSSLAVGRPSTEFILSLWSRGFLNEQHPGFEDLWRHAGTDFNLWRHYRESMFTVPPVGLLMDARNREFISPEQFTVALTRHGYGQPFYRNVIDKLREQVPGPADLIHYAVKEAFSPDVAVPAGLYNDFPQAIMPAMRAQGRAGKAGFQVAVNGVMQDALWPHLDWASHWQPFSATQVIGMFQQHRANRLGRFAGTGLNVIEVNRDTLIRWLRINDYPPELRDNLAALAFTPLRLVDIRQAIAMNYRVRNDPTYAASLPAGLRQRALRYNREWAIEQFRDRGHVPEDAATQTDLATAAAIQQATREQRRIEMGFTRQFRRDVLAAYQLGVIPRERALEGLLATGVLPDTAGQMLDLEEVHRSIRTATAGVNAARRGYMSGSLSEVQAEEALLAAGIDPNATAEYFRQWRLEFNATRRQFTTAQIIRHVAEGRITPEQGRTRLTNLGWIDPDRQILVAEAQGKNLVLRAKAIRAADADRRSRAAELARVQRELVKAQEAVRMALRREIPIGKLQSLVRKKVISQASFLRRAIASGYSESAARAYLQDALTPNPRALYPKTPAELTTKSTLEISPEGGPKEGPVSGQPTTETTRQPPESVRNNAEETSEPPERQRVLSTPARVLNTPPERLGQDGGPVP